MSDLNHILSFIEVIKQGSFAKAAEALGVSKSVVSKHVTALEEHLKTQLLKRTTRKLTLTDLGTQYYKAIKSIDSQIQSAEASLQAAEVEPTGKLKILSPANFSESLRQEIIPSYLSQYPQVELDIQFVRPVEAYLQQDFDIALMWKLNTSTFPDYNLIAKHLINIPIGLFATPTYLNQHGIPTTPTDLQQHNGLASIGTQWQLAKANGDTTKINIPTNLHTNNDNVIYSTTMKHLGIAYSYTYLFQAALAEGKVQQVMPDFTHLHIELYAFYPPASFTPQKTKTFLSMLSAYYQQLGSNIARHLQQK